jgi:DNA primase
MNVVGALLYKVDLVDLVNKYTDLKEDRNGVFRGKCPIHHGDNPTSFAVYPDGTYYCFACHSFGNAIQFYSEVTGYPFYQAVEQLCEEYEVSTDDKLYQRQRSIVGKNTQIAAHMQRHAGKLYDYLTKSRHFTPETIQEFRLGYTKGGFLGESSGLVIPLQDIYGRIVGFTKRRLDEGRPKYRNTADNDVFKKGEILYNYHRAVKRIKDTNTLHVVEGNMDVISAHQQGLACVGYMGSKPTKQQLLLLADLQKRFPDLTIILSVDNPAIDAEGKRSLPRIRQDILKYAPDLNVRCPVFPKGEAYA